LVFTGILYRGMPFAYQRYFPLEKAMFKFGKHFF